MKESTGGLVEIHTAVFLFGFAGLFGKWVALPALIIVFGRVVFASFFLLSSVFVARVNLRLERKMDYLYAVLLGIILVLHWFSFFRSIQLSTVAIGLLTYSTFPVFATFLEPLFFRHRLRVGNILLALVTFGGVALVIPSFEFGNSILHGTLWGVGSGVTFALLSILNRKMVKRYRSMKIALYQDAAASILLLPLFFKIASDLSLYDIALLAILGIVCTGIAHWLFIRGLVRVRAHRAGVIASLEPLYGIIFAYFFLGETPTVRVLVGGAVILGAAFIATIRPHGIRDDGEIKHDQEIGC